MKKAHQQKPESDGLAFDVGMDAAPVVTDRKPATVEIEAEALMPGIECPFTDGCTGRVKVLTDITRATEEGDQINHTRVQQFRCSKCNAIAKGVKVVSKHSGRKFFNRVTGRAES